MLLILFNQSSGVAPPPPAAPSDLTATTVSQSEITLAWVDNSSDEDGFRVERSTDNATWSVIASPGAGTVAYADSGLDPATTYYYRVKAYNAGGDSAYSNIASATTLAVEIPGGGGGGGAWDRMRKEQQEKARLKARQLKEEQERRERERARVRRREVEAGLVCLMLDRMMEGW